MFSLGGLLALLTGCNPLMVEQLRVGQSTRDDALRLMGQPLATHREAAGPYAGSEVLEFSGQPEGTQNWHVVIGPNQLVQDVRPLLTRERFERIQPGMPYAEVRHLLGKPAKTNTYALSPNQHLEWRYLQPPNQVMIFTVEFDPEQRVVKAGSAKDNVQDTRGG